MTISMRKPWQAINKLVNFYYQVNIAEGISGMRTLQGLAFTETRVSLYNRGAGVCAYNELMHLFESGPVVRPSNSWDLGWSIVTHWQGEPPLLQMWLWHPPMGGSFRTKPPDICCWSDWVPDHPSMKLLIILVGQQRPPLLGCYSLWTQNHVVLLWRCHNLLFIQWQIWNLRVCICTVLFMRKVNHYHIYDHYQQSCHIASQPQVILVITN